jgi:hypothetical protein
MFFLGVIAAILVTAIVSSIVAARTSTYARNYAHPPGLLGRQVLRRRARVALLEPKLRMAWPLIIPLIPLNPLILVGVTGPSGLEFAAAYVIAYLFAQIFNQKNIVHTTLRRFRETVAIEVARVIVIRRDLEFASEILPQAAAQEDPCHRIAAVHGLKEWGTPEALGILEGMRNDPDPTVAKLAEEAHTELGKWLDPSNGPCPELPMYIAEQEYIQLGADEDAKEGTGEVGVRNRTKAMERAGEWNIRPLLHAQVRLRRGYPHLFCHECLARAVQLSWGEWDWVECRYCGNTGTLERDVKEVVGQIGGDYEWLLADGVLKLNLWDPEKKKADVADIDVLEIVHREGINYDWAVSAVMEALRNEHPNFEQGIPVRVIGSPSLGNNTLRQLRELDGQFELPEGARNQALS